VSAPSSGFPISRSTTDFSPSLTPPPVKGTAPTATATAAAMPQPRPTAAAATASATNFRWKR